MRPRFDVNEHHQDGTLSQPIAHLHVHSQYSLLDGLTPIEGLVKLTAERGDPAVAKTDHGNLYATMEFLDAGKRFGVKTIVGMEAYVAQGSRHDRTIQERFHLTLLAADEEGFRNLRILSTLAFTEGYYYKPRIDMELLEKHNAGLICLSGCLSGSVQHALKNDNFEKALASAREYKQIFGDRYYLEMMRHGIDEQTKVESNMLRIRDAIQAPLVATNDAHYLSHGDCQAHDVLLCVGTHAKLGDEKRFRFHGDQFYVKSGDEMLEVFADIPEAVRETVKIADRIEKMISGPSVFHIPAFPIPAGTRTEQRLGRVPTDIEYLKSLCNGGLSLRYGARAKSAEIRDRMEYELGVIERMGFASYFLIVWDFIKYARDHDIPVGPGRGSAVGSIIAYALRITDLDPLKYGLIFERFLNPERISMPDIDTDFCIEGREQVVKYVADKYGRDRVAGISTFGTLQSRAAIRDAGRVFGIALEIVDRLAKLVPSGPKGLSVTQARAQIADIAAMERHDPDVRRLLDMAQSIEGSVRSAGTHAAAIIIADAPLVEYIPLATASRSDDSQILNAQYDMDWIEKLGLLKMDFLGLRNLTVMKRTATEIRKREPQFDLDKMPDDDARVYTMLASGDTDGVFQLESGGMKRLMRDMKPDRFEDIVAAVALFRPGPMEFIPRYIAGKRGEESPPELHPALTKIVEPTNGVVIYQEQVMRMATDIAGYSMAEADFLRKVMGKKKVEEVAGARIKFVEACEKQNVNGATATAIFEFIAPFAGYGFNRSHAVAYGWIAYQTAWLKTNYPAEYFAALLTSVEDDAEKMAEYVYAAKRRGVRIMPPDINESGVNFTVVPTGVRFGLASARGITADGVGAVVAERENWGPYANFEEFVSRIHKHDVKKKAVEILIKTGALDCLGEDRGRLLAWIDPTFAKYVADERDRTDGYIPLFDVAESARATKLPKARKSTPAQRSAWEHETLGVYVSSHPADAIRLRPEYASLPAVVDIKNDIDATTVRVAGILRNIVRRTTKAGKPMAKAHLEDASGSIEIIVFSSRMRAVEDQLIGGKPVIVLGQRKVVESRDGDKSTGEGDMETVQSVEIVVDGIDLVKAGDEAA